MDDGPGDDAREVRLREAICAAGRRLGARGLISAAEGNLSIRLSGGRLLTTPTGRRKDELEPGDMATVPLDPDSGLPPEGPRPSSDIAIHRAIYRSRPDVIALVHAHLPASMALTLAGEFPDPSALPETAFHLPVLPFVPFGEMGSQELAGRVAFAFDAEDPRPLAVILERHGAIAVGVADPTGAEPDALAIALETALTAASLETALTAAVDRLELIEVLCRTTRDAILLREARSRW